MGFNLFDLLLPRETKFYTYMEQQVELLEKGCATFKELVGKIENNVGGRDKKGAPGQSRTASRKATWWSAPS